MTSTQEQRPVLKWQYKTPRRQNQSCDQCRRAKRACDAPHGHQTGCSNCLRMGRACTFHGIQKKEARVTKNQSSHAPPRPTTKPVVVAQTSNLTKARTASSSTTSSLPSRPYHPSVDPNNSSLPLAQYFDRVDHASPPQRQNAARPPKENLYQLENFPNPAEHPSWHWNRDASLSEDACENFSGAGLSDSAGELESLYFPFTNEESQDHSSTDQSEAALVKNTSNWMMRQSQQFYPQFIPSAYHLAERTNKSLISASLNSIYADTLENALLCWVTEKSCPYNNEGIGRISGENIYNLAKNGRAIAKYGMVRRVRRLDRASCVLSEKPLTPRESRLASHALHAVIMAFSAQWSHLRGGNTNDLFSNGSGRTNRNDPPFEELGKLMDASLLDFAEEKLASFDRSLQETLWKEAYRALQRAVGIDSFQVAFAQVIFAFTQRPLSRDEFFRLQNNDSASTEFFSSDRVSAPTFNSQPWSDEDSNCRMGGSVPPTAARPEIDETRELLDIDQDPFHLRESLARLSARRIRLTIANSATENVRGTTSTVSPSPIDTDEGVAADRMTFNQLFWLVMMCDTLSCAIYNRSPIVSDEDSVILSKETLAQFQDSSAIDDEEDYTNMNGVFPLQSSSTTDENTDKSPWGIYFLGKRSITYAVPPITWPCPIETATELLNEAAPVKTLLYRKIKQVQNLRFRRSGPEKVEHAIMAALKVYEYWNKNFGPFFTSCLRQHDELPMQIQSWYSVLTGHWNLACFLFSDLVEELDTNGESDPRHCAIRRSCGLLFHIRRQSAFEMADIGRLGRGRKGSSFNQANDFHPTVNDGALLTEPWTDIMIRCFARIAEQFLTWLGEVVGSPAQTSSRRGGWTVADYAPLYVNLNHCIEALWDQGRKSDVAFLLAISFKRRMARFERP